MKLHGCTLILGYFGRSLSFEPGYSSLIEVLHEWGFELGIRSVL